MKTQKLNGKKDNYFLGSYITNLINYPDRSYISISVKSYNGEDEETIYIMVFKKCGFGNKKYTNPTIKILEDAYAQRVPIACVYYNNGDCNVMTCCYANFTTSAKANITEETDAAADFALLNDDNAELPF